jgi:lactoylglutathione lyase
VTGFTVGSWLVAWIPHQTHEKEGWPMIKRVDVVAVYVNDQDAALEFYVDKLGMEKLWDEPMGPDARWVQVRPRGAETSMVLVAKFGDWAPERVGGLQPNTLWADDAEATVQELRAKGVEVTQDPTPQPWGMTEARFKDPDGNEFLLYGPLPG